MIHTKSKSSFALYVCASLLLTFCNSLLASTIDTTNKYAWSENVGWINHATSHSQVRVFEDHLEGFVWSENVGWIRLGSYDSGGTHSYLNNSATNWGVNNDGLGNLSGYAWGENIGWINFNSTNGGPVSISPVTGAFNGYAWSENVGWVHFKNASPAYQVNLQDADIMVTKVANTSPVTPGDALTYTITVTNNGPGQADNIQVEDVLPAGMTFSAVDVGATGAVCNHVAGTVTCTLDTLGASSAASIMLTVDTSASLEASLTNTAQVSLYGLDTVTANNSGSDTTYFGLGDVSCSGDDPVITGDFVSGMILCVGRNTLVTSGTVKILADAVVYFQSPETGLNNGFQVDDLASFTAGGIGNVAPHIAGPAGLTGMIGTTLDFELSHSCEDYEDGMLAINPTDSGPLEGPTGKQIFTINCMDTESKISSKLITVTKQ